MALFVYKAQSTRDNSIVEDTIQAGSRAEAAQNLKTNGYQVLSLRSLEGGRSLFGGTIGVSEKAAFCRFVSTMLRSGMSIPEAVDIIREETKNKALQRILADISFQTQKGKSLSSVLSNYKQDFDPIFLTMVRVGEQSGTLEKSFQYLSKQLAASHELSQKVKGSMMYPAVIVVAMFGNGLIMMLFVLPKIAGAFLNLDVPLPIYTKVVLAVGDYIGKHTPTVVAGMGVTILIMVILFFLQPVRRSFMKFITKVPGIRGVVRQIDIARFSRTLSTLLANGVPIVESLDVASDSLNDPRLKAEAKKFSEGVAKGESLSDILMKHRKEFPPVMIQTIRAGEKSGSLEEVLGEMADFYESEVDYSLKRMTGLLEPIMMLCIGAVVGIMVIIMIAPIYSIIGGLQQSIKQ